VVTHRGKVKTYITLNGHHAAAQLQLQVVRKKEEVVRDLPVSGHSLHGRCMLCLDHTHHVHWSVILQLGLVVVLLVVLLALHLSHVHVVYQERIILKAAEANVVAFCLLISQFILVLHKRKCFMTNIPLSTQTL